MISNKQFLKSTFIVAAIVTAAASVLTACGTKSGSKSTPGKTTTAGTYNIGMTTDLSGPLAAYGPNMRDGGQAYVDYINQHGGINGHKLKLTVLDDKSDPPTGLANVKQLVQQDHVIALSGFFASVVYSASAPVITQSKVPAVGRALTDPMLQPPNQYLWGTAPPTELQGAPMVQFAASKVGDGASVRVATTVLASTASAEFVTYVKDAAKSHNWTNVGAQQVAIGGTDLRPQATAIAAQHPTVVITDLLDTQLVLFDQALRSAGYTGYVLQTDVGSAASSLTKANDPKLFVSRYYPYGTADATGAQMAILRQAASALGTDPNAPYFADGYNQLWVIGQGLKKCASSCNGTALAASLASLGTFDSGGLFTGPVTLSSSWNASAKFVRLYSDVNGTIKSASDALPLGRPKS